VIIIRSQAKVRFIAAMLPLLLSPLSAHAATNEGGSTQVTAQNYRIDLTCGA